jgi:hypothetical protein
MGDEQIIEQPSYLGSIADDFEAVYTNNFHFELSAWDLKVILGQLTQVPNRSPIEWHTAVTMPWGAAKLLRYLLSLNIAIYESANGPISLPPNSIPPRMNPPSGQDDTEQNRAFYELATKFHDEMTGERPKS